MQLLKVALVAMAGLGSTWVARTATDALPGGTAASPAPAALVQDAQPPAPGGGAAPADAPPPAPPAVPQLTPEEMAEELRRAEAELAGGKGAGELKEFRPTRPLPADLAIALPSDI